MVMAMEVSSSRARGIANAPRVRNVGVGVRACCAPRRRWRIRAAWLRRTLPRALSRAALPRALAGALARTLACALSTALPRNLRALLPRLGESDRDRLPPTLY